MQPGTVCRHSPSPHVMSGISSSVSPSQSLSTPSQSSVPPGKAREVAATSHAASDYEQRRIDAAKTTIFASGCISWYLDKDGVPLMWPWSYELFIDEMVKPKLEDYELA